MPNFLTQGRTALIAALQADATLSVAVKTWLDWGPGLRHRFQLEHTYCPICAIYPASGEVVHRFNQAKDLPQDLIEHVIVSHAVADAEEIVAASIRRIELCVPNALGLSAEGLKNIILRSWRWTAYKDKDDPIVMWDVALIIRLEWIRRRNTS